MDKIIVYTAIFGKDHGLLPQKRYKNIDYVCYSDRPHKSRTWEVRVVPSEYREDVRSAKIFKILPHNYFPGYDWSVWIDGNYLIVGDISRLISSIPGDVNMACFDHQHNIGDARNCIYDEYESILGLAKTTGKFKDLPDTMFQQIERYRREGFPQNSGLISGGVLVRRHNAPDVKNCMEHWWDEISRGSYRDQMSFNYVAWKQNFRFHYLPGNIRDNPWFYQIGIHRPDYRSKMFRYRLKRFFGIIHHA